MALMWLSLDALAILPYQVDVIGRAHYEQVLAWCTSQWPYTKGATWCDCLIGYDRAGYTYKFWFQRKEDFQLYQITWT